MNNQPLTADILAAVAEATGEIAARIQRAEIMIELAAEDRGTAKGLRNAAAFGAMSPGFDPSELLGEARALDRMAARFEFVAAKLMGYRRPAVMVLAGVLMREGFAPSEESAVARAKLMATVGPDSVVSFRRAYGQPKTLTLRRFAEECGLSEIMGF